MNRQFSLSTLAITAAGSGALAWAIGDYRAWRALGPGGLPSTWRGWLEMTRLRTMKRNPLALDALKAAKDAAGDIPTLVDLPPRHGARPHVGPHPVPHRQLTDHAPPVLRASLAEAFAKRVRADANRLELVRSHFEKHTLAVTARPECCLHAVAQAACGEAGHVHPSDGSMHMILSPSDACVVIERGWGELHGLAGHAFDLPSTYTLIYAPRDDAEAVTIMRILDAAIAFMTHQPATPVA